ncbi:hypothetical protein E2562_025809 [Oryza meyeriana var. granulata]|uniref:Uncharacterized protein n=1 Tax=Oryza meyeriana var. granulata TaxID=110450 RepID=A0A6G1E421_9ORYZ|nr:hypothetical protein E2562_025809 [Oryza meyeriana var. granulata]
MQIKFRVAASTRSRRRLGVDRWSSSAVQIGATWAPEIPGGIDQDSCTFGNLESMMEWLEIVFNIITITTGLILVTMLIGNIKVFLNATTLKKQAMHTRLRSLEWWMK